MRNKKRSGLEAELYDLIENLRQKYKMELEDPEDSTLANPLKTVKTSPAGNCLNMHVAVYLQVNEFAGYYLHHSIFDGIRTTLGSHGYDFLYISVSGIGFCLMFQLREGLTSAAEGTVAN